LLCTLLEDPKGEKYDLHIDYLTSVYLSFICASFNEEFGRFRNFMSFSRQWLEEFGSEDSHARALWAVGTGAAHSRSAGQQRLSMQLFERGLPVVEFFTSPRAWCFTLLGIHEFLKLRVNAVHVIRLREILVEKLLSLWNEAASENWPWFESILTYDNARFSQALIISGESMARPDITEIGFTSLRWLVSIQKSQLGFFRPIGNHGFYQRDGSRADYDQQPVEAQAMVSACL
jgi:hypothetical protein